MVGVLWLLLDALKLKRGYKEPQEPALVSIDVLGILGTEAVFELIASP